MNLSYLVRHVSYQLHTMIRLWPHSADLASPAEVFCGVKNFKDLALSKKLFFDFLEPLKETLSLPLLFSLNKTLYYAFIPSSCRDFLVGPVKFSSQVPMNHDLSGVSFPETFLSCVPECAFSLFCGQVLLIYNLLHEKTLDQDSLITASCMDDRENTALDKNLSDLFFQRREAEEPHNPYDQEVREFLSIERGEPEMLKKSLLEDYPGKIGVLAQDEVRNMRNRGIVVVTLASRAAIRGGLLPEISFSMSDVFIQKLEKVSDTSVLLNMIHQFEFKYAKMVEELNIQKAGRPKKDQNLRTEQCKDYIFKHLHEKIRVQDIADKLFLNANYLSEIFRQNEGVTITDFILNEKIKLTKNLLTYSPYTYSEIAAYLGFSSQSHLGKVFKRLTHMTLKQYRDQYGIRER